MTTIRNFLEDESGATAIEYALIAGIISISIILALGTLEDGVSNIYSKIGAWFTAVAVP